MVFILQEFNIGLRDRKGSENQVADHLSRLEIDGAVDKEQSQVRIKETLLDEQLFAILVVGQYKESVHLQPVKVGRRRRPRQWYTGITNYLVAGQILMNLNF